MCCRTVPFNVKVKIIRGLKVRPTWYLRKIPIQFIADFVIQFKEHWNQIFNSYADLEKKVILSG